MAQTHQVGRSKQLCVYAWRPYQASFCPKHEANELPMTMVGFRVQLDPWNLVQTHQVGRSEQLCVYAWRPYRASFCPKCEANELPMAMEEFRVKNARVEVLNIFSRDPQGIWYAAGPPPNKSDPLTRAAAHLLLN